MPNTYGLLPTAANQGGGTRGAFTSYGNRWRNAIVGTNAWWEIVGDQTAETETALLRKGVVANAVADDSAALQDALDSLCVAGKRTLWSMPPGLDIRINSGLTIGLPLAAYHWHNTRFRCDGMTSGAAITATGQSVDPYNRFSAASAFEGLVLDGPDADSTAVDAIKFGDGTTITGQSPIRDVAITGFRDQLVFGANCYIQQLMNVTARSAHRRVLAYLGTGNSGESIRLTACDLSGAANASETAVGIYTALGTQSSLILDGGTSLDYCDIGADLNGGMLQAFGAHFESSTNKPHFKAKYTGGNPGMMLGLYGCRFVHGVLGQQTEDALGRPSWILIDSATGDRLSVIVRGAKYEGYGKSGTEFVTYTGNANPKIVVDDHHIEQQGNAIGRVCDRTSLVAAVWATTGSLSYQDMRADPGKNIIVRCTVDGGLTPQVRFLAHDGTQIDIKTMTPAGSGSGAACSQTYLVPAGTVSARLQVPAANVSAVHSAQAWVV